MNLNLIWKMVRREFKVGPRNSFFLWAIIMPFALTLVLQVAFGTLFEPKPRLGIVDEGDSSVTAAALDIEGIDVTLLDDVDELKRLVENNDLDAGIVLASGFDEAVRAGERPKLEFYMGGESLASNRIIISVTTIDLIRSVEGGTPPVTVETVLFGDKGLPIAIRLIPLLVFYALVIAGIFVPASSLVGDKEKGTLTALLVTPVRIGEVLTAKWALGFIFASFMAALTLFLNRALGAHPLDVIVVVLIAAALNAMLGLLVGVVSRSSTTMFALIKGAGIFLFAPVIFYIFPEWPQWIARIFPLYWIIEPIWQVSIMGEQLEAVWFELSIAVAITAALVPAIVLASRRMDTQS